MLYIKTKRNVPEEHAQREPGGNMKNIMKSVLVLIILAFLANGFVMADCGDMKAEFQKMNDKIAKAILAGDHATIMSMYTDDVYSMPSYSPMMKGKEAIAKHAQMEEKMGIKMKTFAIKTIDVFGSKDQMIQVGTYSLTIAMPGQEKPIPDKGKYLTVWQKQADGSWKIKAETWNSDINPMMMGHEKK
jgi:uncharacterized protein (TIGR02246 family)